MQEADLSRELSERVTEAARRGTPLRLVGGNTKAWYGRPVAAEPLALAGHRGVVDYQPSELVVRLRGGTRLAELEALLAAEGQWLACDPPRFGAETTVAGALAAGLAGPGRPYLGGLRDAVLGVTLINGRGEVVRLGGAVMKNVAGFDGFRPMVGALGSLGVILEVCLKVAPRPASRRALALALPREALAERAEAWWRAGVPVVGAAHDGERLRLCLAGSESAVDEAVATLGGDEEDPAYWSALRDQRLPFFRDPGAPLWRLLLPPGARPALPGEALVEWGGRQWWWRGEAPVEVVFAEAARLGGQASRWRGGDPRAPVFAPLAPPLLALQRRLKAAFDPEGLFNPGIHYPEL
ncbi:glycolate oxidase subunit GlcE [Halomonas sp. NCCP-2165]|nr:glycolate oxidase subunit GlcE [Halomonas sp. NCCP-2165]GKW50651.1 glycolate oxidase [Halomonas sp. NCCP-2165]